MSDKPETPRTDAAQKAYEDYCGRIADACREGKVSLSMAMDEFKKEVGPCPNDDWETARTMERELTQWREVAGRLAEAAQTLHDFQNGSPLPKYDKPWSKAMNAVEEALETYEQLNRKS